MPINEIKVNNSLKYYVVDSKMEKLITWLDDHAIKQEDKSVDVIEDEKVS